MSKFLLNDVFIPPNVILTKRAEYVFTHMTFSEVMWPFQVAAVDTYGLYGARISRLEESFWQSWALLLVPHAKL